MAKGTEGENAVVAALRPIFPLADRRPKHGANDCGDIGGVAQDVVIQVKAQPNRYQFGEWLKQVAQQMENADATIGVVWAKQKGKGKAEDWIVAMRGSVFIELLAAWVKQ